MFNLLKILEKCLNDVTLINKHYKMLYDEVASNISVLKKATLLHRSKHSDGIKPGFERFKVGENKSLV